MVCLGADTSEKRQDGILQATRAVGQSLEGWRRLFEICHGLQRAMQPYADLVNRIPVVRVPRFELVEHESAMRSLINTQRRVADAVERFNLGPLAMTAGKLARHVGTAQGLDDAGWLPHHSTPFRRCYECWGDSDALNAMLSRHYRARWTEVRLEMETRLGRYDVDEEAKATFTEALEAHEAGLYRSVCRVLFPEIERVSRMELHGGRIEPIASQRLLRELTRRLPLSCVEPPGFYHLSLFRRLTKHLYEHVRDEKDRRRFARDPVPNRHAAMHGLVVYSSMQNSLNALFMAEHIFQVIGMLRSLSAAQRRDDASAQTGS